MTVGNQGIGRARLLLKTLGEKPCLFQPQAAAASLAGGCVTPVSASVPTWLSSLCLSPGRDMVLHQARCSRPGHWVEGIGDLSVVFLTAVLERTVTSK